MLEESSIATLTLTPDPLLFQQVGSESLNPALRATGIERGLADGRAAADQVHRHLTDHA
jgi:hypothetical protein